MAAKAEATGITHMTYFTWRWVPHYQYLRHLIDEGYIGRCYHCLIRYTAGYGAATGPTHGALTARAPTASWAILGRT